MFDKPRAKQESSKGSLPGFTSFKCCHPIYYRARFCRDALIQATLDPRLLRLESVAWQQESAAAFAFFADTHAGRCLVYISDESASDYLYSSALAGLVVTISRQEVLSEPRLSTARMIWSHRQRIVPLTVQIAVLRMLSNRSEPLSLGELEERLGETHEKITESVLALVCRGDLVLDDLALLTPQSILSLPPTWFVPTFSQKAAQSIPAPARYCEMARALAFRPRDKAVTAMYSGGASSARLD